MYYQDRHERNQIIYIIIIEGIPVAQGTAAISSIQYTNLRHDYVEHLIRKAVIEGLNIYVVPREPYVLHPPPRRHIPVPRTRPEPIDDEDVITREMFGEEIPPRVPETIFDIINRHLRLRLVRPLRRYVRRFVRSIRRPR